MNTCQRRNWCEKRKKFRSTPALIYRLEMRSPRLAGGALVHRGRVTDIAPDHGMFWIMDDLNGGRRLLDLAEVQVTWTKGAAAGTPAVG